MSKAAPSKQQEVQRIVEALSLAIAQQRLKPGTRLIETQIVEALDANRNHVQSALQRMMLQHIVTIEPNRGARVAQPEAREAQEIFIARRAIERAIISSITPDKISAWSDKLEQQHLKEREVIKRNDRQDIIRQLSEFHLLLAEISDNQVLREILANLMARSSLIVSLYLRHDAPDCQCCEHSSIIEALKTGDIRLAQTLMEEHLNVIEQQLNLTTSPEVFDLRQALRISA